MSRIGKIARLPHAVREELNQRLLDGEPGKCLVEWLNGRPDVQAVVREHYDGKPINEPNLTQWMNGGYEDWRRQQEALQVVSRVVEESSAVADVVSRGAGVQGTIAQTVARSALGTPRCSCAANTGQPVATCSGHDSATRSAGCEDQSESRCARHGTSKSTITITSTSMSRSLVDRAADMAAVAIVQELHATRRMAEGEERSRRVLKIVRAVVRLRKAERDHEKSLREAGQAERGAEFHRDCVERVRRQREEEDERRVRRQREEAEREAFIAEQRAAGYNGEDDDPPTPDGLRRGSLRSGDDWNDELGFGQNEQNAPEAHKWDEGTESLHRSHGSQSGHGQNDGVVVKDLDGGDTGGAEVARSSLSSNQCSGQDFATPDCPSREPVSVSRAAARSAPPEGGTTCAERRRGGEARLEGPPVQDMMSPPGARAASTGQPVAVLGTPELLPPSPIRQAQG